MLLRDVLEMELNSYVDSASGWMDDGCEAYAVSMLARIMYLQEAIEQFKRLSRKANQKAFGFAGWTVNACEFLNQWEKEEVRK